MIDSDSDESTSVLFLAGDFYPKQSGGAFEDWSVARHLVEAGDSVTVVTPRNTDTATRETVEGVDIKRPFRGHNPEVHPNSIRGVFNRLLFGVLVIPYLVMLCYRIDFDVVYSTNHLLHPSATIVSTLFHLPHISFVGYSPSIREDASLWNPLVIMERLNFRYFMGNRVLCRTPSIRELLSESYGLEVFRLDGIVDREAIESAVASADSVESAGSESNSRLIFVGRLEKIKNPTALPHIISGLPAGYSLRIVGDGTQREALESAIEQTDVSDRVELEGQLPHQETLQLIYASDLVLLPSALEAYPTVVFEALVMNTPVLATPVGVLPSINHPKLRTADLEEFPVIIQNGQLESENGINGKTLDRFDVNRFAAEVRSQMNQGIINNE